MSLDVKFLSILNKLIFFQVEFESVKYEIRRLEEEIDLLNSKVDELTKLKQIAEKQMEEALEALQVRLS